MGVSTFPTRSRQRPRNERVVTLLVAAMLVACASDSGSPVPLGKREALEQLMVAYETASDRFPSNPRLQSPSDKREFVEQVFRLAGYSYSETIVNMAQLPLDSQNAEHCGLAELVIYPIQGLTDSDASKLYSQREFSALQTIKGALECV